MNDPKKEHLPLLCDDFSEDEYQIHASNQIYKRRAISSSNGRAKYHVKGAAEIIKRWPDHISSLLTYWWMGLAMIALTVFIIYNSVLALAKMPPQSRLIKMQPPLKLDSKAIEYSASYKTIYMHVINDNLTMDLNDYMPYIEIVAKNYPTFKYNFVILFNDTLDNVDDNVNDIQKNEIAMRSLLKTKDYKIATRDNIFIQRKSLTSFLNGSPIKKYWRHLPQKFMSFLIRCISIWNKGGISINPLLFTPKSPHPDYMDEIKNILKNIENSKTVKKEFYKELTPTVKIKKRVNNIRDIINELENNNSAFDESNDKLISLAEEETKNVPSKVTKNASQIESLTNVIETNSGSLKNVRKKHILHKQLTGKKDFTDSVKLNAPNFNDTSNNIYEKRDKISNRNETTDKKLFPMFLKYLFSPSTNAYNSASNDPLSENIMAKVSDESLPHKNDEYVLSNYALPLKPVSREMNNLVSSDTDQFLDLNLDLKGNIVATKTPCHAFLGTIFNNAIHHVKDETVTDFIIAELSIFCKGTWTSCKGVNVIFL
ncbi:uncharacterized protein LOC123695331 [Colias croceus]|uniref:uncharacterized protein LOC123695331 n=1 Tax=Colias crocea TaxID=72248 RepID=UPI001E27C48F|nr:uncharacterized protein LOC123695331 [Colias croceus]